MDTGILANGLAAIGYLVMDVIGFGALIWATYSGTHTPNDKQHPRAPDPLSPWGAPAGWLAGRRAPPLYSAPISGVPG